MCLKICDVQSEVSWSDSENLMAEAVIWLVQELHM